MKNRIAGRRTERILVGILGAVFALILVLLPVHAFISTWGGAAIGPLEAWKAWKEAALLLCVPLVVWLFVLRPDIVRTLWHDKLNRLILAYVVFTVLMGLISPASRDAIAVGLLMNLRFLAMFILAQILLASGAPWVERLKKWAVGWLLGTAVFLGVVSILQVTVLPRDFLAHFGYDRHTTIAPYLLVDEHPESVRAFATMRGPNTLGAYLLMPLALALLLWWQDKRRWWAAGVAGLVAITLVLTGARSAWLGALAMAATLAFATLPKQKLIKWLKWGTIPVVVASALFLWLAATVPQLRLAVFHSGGSDPNESLLEGSSEAHIKAALDGLERVAAEPFGYGVGVSGPASFYNNSAPPLIPENYFVQIAEETGIIGLGLFVAISGAVAFRLWQQRQLWPRVLLASFVGLNVINLLLHGWADDPTAMTWWALAGLFMPAKDE